MRTDVVVTKGRRRGRLGYIYGTLENRHPLVTKVLVIFDSDEDAAVPLKNLAPAGCASVQLELGLRYEKSPPPYGGGPGGR